MLYYEFFKDEQLAYIIAQKGDEKEEKYSKCLLGFFTAHGIGTTKDLNKGVSTILDGKAEDLFDQFATEIGIYYSKKETEEQNNKVISSNSILT